MNPNVYIWLAAGGITILYLVVRYIMNTVWNKTKDAVRNKLADKNNAQNGKKEENLSDRY